MIAIQNISIQFGARSLFRDLSFVIQPKERIAFAGPNGAGKSTLMKMLVGELTPDSGRIIRARGVSVGYLAQEGVEGTERTVYEEVESAFAGVIGLQAKIDDLGESLTALDPASEAYRETLDRMGDLQLRLEDADPARIRPRIETVLLGLGFARDKLDRPTRTFSGGWRMRIALARLLLQEPDLLLLDEPTNHLDLDSQRWVEKYLLTYPGGIALISHDRAFLDSIVRRTLAFEHGRVEEYSGNYSFYERESVARRELLVKAKANQDRVIRKTQQFIDRFRAKATKASQAQSRIKMLERIERIELENEGPEIHFQFPPAPAGGQSVLRLENVAKQYGPLTVFENFNLAIDKGDRIAVVGVNGAGKSTFSRLVSRREEPTSGKIIPGHNLITTHFAQDQAEELNPELTALATLEEVDTGGAHIDRRSVLGCFLFRGDDVFKPVSVLSGGEKSRLALARMLLAPSNFLVLDEPTNHLDMASQTRLQAALLDYEGSFVVVSHNRDFLDPLVNKVLEFRVGLPPRVFLGNVSDYIAKREEEERLAATASPHSSTHPGTTRPPAQANRKDQRRAEAQRRQERARRLKPLQQELESVETRITALEEERTTLATRANDPALFEVREEAMLVIHRMRDLEKELESSYTRWNDLTEEIETVEAELPITQDP